MARGAEKIISDRDKIACQREDDCRRQRKRPDNEDLEDHLIISMLPDQPRCCQCRRHVLSKVSSLRRATRQWRAFALAQESRPCCLQFQLPRSATRARNVRSTSPLSARDEADEAQAG